MRYRNVVLGWILPACLACSTAQAQYVHTRGAEVVDAANKPLLLRGTNLGDWFVPEGYMWHLQGSVESAREIESLVTELIGPTKARAFWHEYRQSYVTQADVRLIKQAGFNSIRVPMHYKFFLSDDAEGFQLVDRLLGWCKQEGVYVVLDMHAAPGAQTGKNIDDRDGYPWLMIGGSILDNRLSSCLPRKRRGLKRDRQFAAETVWHQAEESATI